jgi:hypothetical protein
MPTAGAACCAQAALATSAPTAKALAAPRIIVGVCAYFRGACAAT